MIAAPPMRALLAATLLSTVLVFDPAPALAVASGDESTRAESSDADYAAGQRAFDSEDWQGVLDNMGKVVERRPWHDNAWSRMGYAARRLGDFDLALAHYGKALDLNPRNRGALEYLGEAYLDLGRLDDAKIMLARLEAECKKVAVGFTNGGWNSGCEEW